MQERQGLQQGLLLLDRSGRRWEKRLPQAKIQGQSLRTQRPVQVGQMQRPPPSEKM
jgi:hypothetical protein